LGEWERPIRDAASEAVMRQFGGYLQDLPSLRELADTLA
jgi:hypothetical protein